MTLEEIERLLNSQLALVPSSPERDKAVLAIAGLLEVAANANNYLAVNRDWRGYEAWGWRQEMAKSLDDLERLRKSGPESYLTGGIGV